MVMMQEWQRQIAESVTTGEALARHLPISALAVNRIAAAYPMRIPPYWRTLIASADDPFYRQAVPSPMELASGPCTPDPFDESGATLVPGLIHRYPNRVLLLVTRQCAMLCRHCMRKRRTSISSPIADFDLPGALDYVRRHPDIREVILSGGDPLMLLDAQLDTALAAFSEIDHVAVCRIHSRMPCTLPQRITPALVDMLERHTPLVVVTQFNHPAEITAEAAAACARLLDAGIPVMSQAVLLKGVNDSAELLTRLIDGLLSIHVQPYYLHHPDPVCGTGHFQLPVREGLAIVEILRRRIPSDALPKYVMDIPGTNGKVPLIAPGPDDGGRLIVRCRDGTTVAIELDAQTPMPTAANALKGGA